MDDRELVSCLCEIEEGLTDWEVEFVESLAKWMERHDSLTPKQRGVANRIFEEKYDG